jgi:hypothetical protein
MEDVAFSSFTFPFAFLFPSFHIGAVARLRRRPLRFCHSSRSRFRVPPSPSFPGASAGKYFLHSVGRVCVQAAKRARATDGRWDEAVNIIFSPCACRAMHARAAPSALRPGRSLACVEIGSAVVVYLYKSCNNSL